LSKPPAFGHADRLGIPVCHDDLMKIRFAVAPGNAASADGDLLGFSSAIEAGGFDGIWLSDVPVAPVIDPLLGLALVAGQTTRLRLGANVVPLGRNPFLLAKELAQLDRISHGRLLLSFVTGIGQPGEREALGLREAGRGEVLEEVLGLLRAWWAGETVDHTSDRWSFTSLAAVARPVQDPLEVWLGGRGPKALDRVGRVADGWLGAQVTAHEARAARERIQASAENAGREIDPEHFGLSIAYTRAPPDPELLRTLTSRRPDIDPLTILPVGAMALRSAIHDYVEAGLSKFVIRPGAAVDSWVDESEWLADTILDLQT
jgi:probable F420-dependent oxidoreductase